MQVFRDNPLKPLTLKTHTPTHGLRAPSRSAWEPKGALSLRMGVELTHWLILSWPCGPWVQTVGPPATVAAASPSSWASPRTPPLPSVVVAFQGLGSFLSLSRFTVEVLRALEL